MDIRFYRAKWASGRWAVYECMDRLEIMTDKIKVTCFHCGYVAIWDHYPAYQEPCPICGDRDLFDEEVEDEPNTDNNG